MAEIAQHKEILEWHSNYLQIYDSSINTYREIYTVYEAKKLIKQSSEPFIRAVAMIYSFSLAATRSPYTEKQIFMAKLEKEARQLKKLLAYSSFSGELLDHLLKTARKSQSINGSKTDIYHEAVRLSIKLEDYFNKKESLKRQA